MSLASSWNVVEVVRPQPGACRDHGDETAQAHALQKLLRDLHLERTVAAGLRRQRDADRVADALLQEHGERGRRRDDAFGAHARLGEAEMERKIGPGGQHRVDRDQILHRADLGGEHDFVGTEPKLDGARCGQERRLHDRLVHHLARVLRQRRKRILVHEPGEQILIETAPVDADADGSAVARGNLDDLPELLVALVLEADIAGIDAVFRERHRAIRIIGEQCMAVIVKVADQRRGDAEYIEPLADDGHRGSGFCTVHRDAHKLRTGAGERRDLARGRIDIGGVGIRHRLHDNWGVAAKDDAANIDRNGAPSRLHVHGSKDTSDLAGARHRSLGLFPPVMACGAGFPQADDELRKDGRR